MISPKVLRQYNVPYVQARQEAGEFIVLNAAAFHAGFNCGFNCAGAWGWGVGVGGGRVGACAGVDGVVRPLEGGQLGDHRVLCSLVRRCLARHEPHPEQNMNNWQGAADFWGVSSAGVQATSACGPCSPPRAPGRLQYLRLSTVLEARRPDRHCTPRPAHRQFSTSSPARPAPPPICRGGQLCNGAVAGGGVRRGALHLLLPARRRGARHGHLPARAAGGLVRWVHHSALGGT